MTLTVQATYENGVLKPDQPLPLKEHEKVQLSIHPSADVQKALEAVQRSYGLIHWTGDSETLRRIGEDDEFGLLESPLPSPTSPTAARSSSTPIRWFTTQPRPLSSSPSCSNTL
jgi:predicted DNA-binding antitoxin AbrB/MazE fold protein